MHSFQPHFILYAVYIVVTEINASDFYNFLTKMYIITTYGKLTKKPKEQDGFGNRRRLLVYKIAQYGSKKQQSENSTHPTSHRVRHQYSLACVFLETFHQIGNESLIENGVTIKIN